jgi:hypothetical protein
MTIFTTVTAGGKSLSRGNTGYVRAKEWKRFPPFPGRFAKTIFDPQVVYYEKFTEESPTPFRNAPRKAHGLQN